MIKLIAGLGNPAPQYEKTRHNTGFVFLQKVADNAGVVFSGKTAWRADIATVDGVRLLRPQTYMNESGFAVGPVARYFNVAAEELLVVHDEVDFIAGDIRLKFGGGEAGHNGLRDISRAINSKNYWRLRIGVGAENNPAEKNTAAKNTADFVLHPPNEKEKSAIDGAINRALSVWPEIIGGDMQKAMLSLHTKEQPQKEKTGEK